jgi:hypothetical protein
VLAIAHPFTLLGIAAELGPRCRQPVPVRPSRSVA